MNASIGWTNASICSSAKSTGRFDEVNRKFGEIDRRFDEVDRKFVEVNRQFDKIDRRFEGVEAKLESISGRLDTLLIALFYVGGGLVVALATALAALIATRL